MIYINSITLRNFRSFGNIPCTFELTKHQTTFITGENGAGKSTAIPHAIIFGLFGKNADPKDKKAALVNSMNNKDCVVTVHLTAKGKEVKVVRGIKPNIFEIWVDGKLLPTEAKKGEHQKYIEELIGYTFSVFCNNISLTLAMFKPFISLTASDRRETVDKYLDLTLFPFYVERVKSDIKQVKLDIGQNEIKQLNNTSKIDGSIRVIESIQQQVQRAATTKELVLDQTRMELSDYQSTVRASEDTLRLSKMRLPPFDGVRENQAKLLDLRAAFTARINDIIARGKKYMEYGDVCPTCKGSITTEAKEIYIKDINAEKLLFTSNLEKINTLIAAGQVTIDEWQKGTDQIQVHENKLSLDKNNVVNKQRELDALILEMSKPDLDFEKSFKDEEDLQANLKTITDELVSEFNQLSEQLDIYTKTLEMFGDKGVKTVIIKQYIPLFNKKVNEYLENMNLFINFEMSSDFKVEFKAPDRRGQVMASLSSGQQRRIDIAIILAWRYISQIKNSNNMNILILDEVLNPLDHAGHEIFIEMFKKSFPDINLFVTSQNEHFAQFFDNTLEFQLVGGFTKF